MTRWKKDATEFEVGVINLTSSNGPASKTCIIPKPIFELLKKPTRLKFKIIGKRIEVQSV